MPSLAIVKWSSQAKFVAPDTVAADTFGSYLAMSDTTVMIGAIGGDINAQDSGKVYVYNSIDNIWSLQAILTAPIPLANENFGSTVAFSNNYAMIGSSGTSSNTFYGVAYVFRKGVNGFWSLQSLLTAFDFKRQDYFAGKGLAMSDDAALISSYLDDDSGLNSGNSTEYLY
jgi:hypothetical protein